MSPETRVRPPGRTVGGSDDQRGDDWISTHSTATVNDPTFCPLSCSRPEGCTWRCPISITGALDEVLVDLLAVAS